MRALYILLILLANGLTFAQDFPLEKYASTITKEELSVHVHRLASAAFEGRYTGTAGQKEAAEYIRNEFGKDGVTAMGFDSLQPYYQEFVLEKCYWEEQRLSAYGMKFEAGEDFVFLSDPVNAEGKYPVTFAGFGIHDSLYSDYGNLELEGKIALVFSGEPFDENGHYLISGQAEPSRKAYYWSKAALAAEKGAAGLMVISRDEDDFRKYLKTSGDYRARANIAYPSDEQPAEIFSIYINLGTAASILRISPENLKEIRDEMASSRQSVAGRYSGEMDLMARSQCTGMNTENVIGIVEGTDLKDEAVVVVAHYDHLGVRNDEIYYGADDNASGTAAVMEIAEAFTLAADHGYRPLRTVVFLAVSAEEIGLYGSRFYSENPLIPLEKTYACINIDMIGRASKKLRDSIDYVSGFAYVSEDILGIARYNNRLYAPQLADRMEYRERLRGGSDHYYFAKSGIPSLFYFAGIHEDYHEPTDTPDKILYDRMELITRAIFGTVWDLANSVEELRMKN